MGLRSCIWDLMLQLNIFYFRWLLTCTFYFPCDSMDMSLLFNGWWEEGLDWLISCYVLLNIFPSHAYTDVQSYTIFPNVPIDVKMKWCKVMIKYSWINVWWKFDTSFGDDDGEVDYGCSGWWNFGGLAVCRWVMCGLFSCRELLNAYLSFMVYYEADSDRGSMGYDNLIDLV